MLVVAIMRGAVVVPVKAVSVVEWMTVVLVVVGTMGAIEDSPSGRAKAVNAKAKWESVLTSTVEKQSVGGLVL